MSAVQVTVASGDPVTELDAEATLEAANQAAWEAAQVDANDAAWESLAEIAQQEEARAYALALEQKVSAPLPAALRAPAPASTPRHAGACADIDFVALMGPVARKLRGEPNGKLSSATNLRYGTHGSLSIDLNKGVWKHHDPDGVVDGGGVLDLIVREGAALDRKEARRWLEQQNFVSQPPPPTPARNPNAAARNLAKVQADYRNCDEATADQEYVVRKKGKPDGVRVVSYPLNGWGKFKGKGRLFRWLAVPAYQGVGNTGEVRSVQYIGPGKGEKLNAFGVQIKGHSFTVGTLQQGKRAYVAEGIGHAWSLNTVTGDAAVVSFGAGHIEVIAQGVQEAGAIPVIVPDRGKELDAARIATRLGCLYAPLPPDLLVGADVNDLHLERGADAVRAVIDAAATVQEWHAAQKPALGSALAEVEDVHGLEQVGPMSWPNLDMKSMKPLNTIPNLRHLLRVYRFTVRYDVIRKELTVTHPGQRGTRDNVKSKAIDTVISLCALNSLPKTEASSFLLSIGDDNPRNPVTDFITSKSWDGVSRFDSLMATVQTKPGFDRELLALLLRRWLVSAVAAAAMPNGFWSKGVLVFQGDQSLGKTKWFRALLPSAMRDLVRVDAHIDPANKDTIISAVSHWLVELGELDGTLRKADIARLKGFISQDIDQFRRPYGRAEEKFQRRTVFFASVNPERFLADETGNVRWWTVPVIGINSGHGVDMQQLWAEVFTWFDAGERWWLDPHEEARLNSANADHEQSDPIDELIASKYDFKGPAQRRLTATEVLLELGYLTPNKKLLNDAGAAMRKRFGASTKHDGRRVFRVPSLIRR